MNINLLKTFLEVARLRHFGKAADKIFLTQAAVSARIKQIEENVGARLLTRERNNIQLTPEGRRLALAAENIVKQWEQAKNEITLASQEGQQLVRLGMINDIWYSLSPGWLHTNRTSNPNLMFQLQTFSARLLQERLLSDEVDAAVMFDPPYHPGFSIREIGTIELQLLSTREISASEVPLPEYIYVDWGESFSEFHEQQSEDLLNPVLGMNVASIAIDYLRHHDGMAFLPPRQIQYMGLADRFYEVSSFQSFQREVFYVYRKNHSLAESLERITTSLY
jgi:DNA-binding transcriptional LysR family regulator